MTNRTTNQTVHRMVPPAPPDPALPALPDALDGEAMREHLAGALLSAGGDAAIEDCRPTYIRYKPGTSMIVLYEVRHRGPATAGAAGGVDARARTTLAHLRLGPPGRAAAEFGRRSLARLVARSLELDPGPPQPRVALVPALEALVQFYPIDRRLRSLVRVAHPLEAGAAADGATVGVELVRYRPARSPLLRHSVPDDPAAGI